MGKIFLIFVCSSFLINCQIDSKYSKYYGIEYRSINEIEEFNDFEEAGGVMLEKYLGEEFALEKYIKDNTNLIVFEKLLRTDSKEVKYKILDILEITGLKNTQAIGNGTCRKENKDDSEIIAIYTIADTEYYKQILKSWRANMSTGKIESIEVKNIDCINEGWGVD